MKTLDFIVIGAQKSGTTSLFEYLRQHPDVHIPIGKEIPFFSEDERYDLGWERYIKEFFSGARQEAMWGTVSPQYMADPLVPGRVRKAMPQAKLIALLRNPIHRALSHYKHTVREGIENRSFDEVVDDLVDERKALHARTLRISGTAGSSDTYLVRGEYARILSQYRNFFSEEQICVLFSEELDRSPRESLSDVLQFLGISNDFQPQNLGERYHVGGTKKRVPSTDRLAKVGVLRQLWRTMPGRYRMIFHRACVKLEHWSTVHDPPANSEVMAPSTLKKLVNYYHPDVERLRVITGREVPWPEFGDSRAEAHR